MNIQERSVELIRETTVSCGPVGGLKISTVRDTYDMNPSGDVYTSIEHEFEPCTLRSCPDEQSARAFHQLVVDEVAKFCERIEQLFEKGA